MRPSPLMKESYDPDFPQGTVTLNIPMGLRHQGNLIPRICLGTKATERPKRMGDNDWRSTPLSSPPPPVPIFP